MSYLSAYIALFAISAGVVAYDAHERKEGAILSAAELAYAANPKAPRVEPRQEVAEVALPIVAAPKKAQAPYGVFFLKTAVEVPTSDGSRTFRAGAKVQFVRRMDGKVKVTRDGTDFLVEESQITDDAESAAALKVAANKAGAKANKGQF